MEVKRTPTWGKGKQGGSRGTINTDGGDRRGEAGFKREKGAGGDQLPRL